MTGKARSGMVGAAILVVVLVGIGIGIGHRPAWFSHSLPPSQPSPVSVKPVPPASVPPRPAPAPQAVLPSFDAVQVAPDGHAVIAGRAAPGAQVTVLDHGKPIGTVTADPQGQWVLIPDQPLPPGPRQLSLAARAPGASKTTRSDVTVAVVVPKSAPAATRTAPMAVLLPQNPAAPAQAMASPLRAGQSLVLDIVEYLAAGPIDLSGRAVPAAQVRISVNDRPLGTATADAAGRWAKQLTSGVPVGRYRLRLVAVAPDGTPAGSLAIELRRAAPGERPGDYFAVVPGNNLWHVAERSYGAGLRYVEIYRANPERISDPNLIYPGQLLDLPTQGQAVPAK